MKTKITLLVLLLNLFAASGQNATETDSLTISLRMARQIEMDLIELDYLKIENGLQKSEIELLDKRLELSSKKEQNLNLRLSLVQKQADNWNKLYESEKKKQPNTWDRVRDILMGIGAGAVLILIAK